MDPLIAQFVCNFPDRLHPVSRLFLDAFLEGRMTTQQFLRFFSLPNSDYIPIAKCFVTLLAS